MIQTEEAANTATKEAKSTLKGTIQTNERFSHLEIAARIAAKKTQDHYDARARFYKIPKNRREMAKKSHAIAAEIGKSAAKMGSDYSGRTNYLCDIAETAYAYSIRDKGDIYSRRCTYRKTDATHYVMLRPEGIPCLVEAEDLRRCSARDGLHLIALYPDHSAVWVRTKGKAISSESGWVVGNGALCYHSTKSAAHAEEGFRRKLAAHEREEKLARDAGKTERRARLISRLCCGAMATVKDAKRKGYCDPGIEAFQSRYGIGDSCSLPELVRTGNHAAAALALDIARKLSRRQTLSA